MNTSAVYFKARETILEMFQDRGYEGDYMKAKELTIDQLSKYNFFKVLETKPNKIENPPPSKPIWIDLWGFFDTRKIHIQTTVEVPNPAYDPNAPGANEPATISQIKDEIKEIKMPVYVHFSNKLKPKKSGLKRNELYKSILADEEVGPWLKEAVSKYDPRLNPIKTRDPQTWLYKLMDEEIMAGVHVMIVYNGWDYSQNKVPKDLFYVYQSSENSPVVYDLEIWPAHTLVFNITKHHIVPKHTLLKASEKTKFLIEQGDFYLNPTDKEKIKDMDPFKKERYLENYFFQIMQKISLYDPVNLYYYGRLRQIYMIVRDGKSVTYRIVKKSPLLQDQRK